AGSPGRTYAVRTGRAAWRIRTGPGKFTVAGGGAGPADVTVSGTPAAVLRWVWNREGGSSDVTIQGPPEAVEGVKRCITTGAQSPRDLPAFLELWLPLCPLHRDSRQSQLQDRRVTARRAPSAVPRRRRSP